jgi:antitoxin MazE
VDAVDSTYMHWGQKVRTRIGKWGNSAAVRIPAAVMRATRLDLDEAVDVREEAGRIVIDPVRQKTYDLGKLLKGITSKNQHEAVDFGPPMGKEVW